MGFLVGGTSSLVFMSWDFFCLGSAGCNCSTWGIGIWVGYGFLSRFVLTGLMSWLTLLVWKHSCLAYNQISHIGLQFSG